jgi:SAM-dependent methyltransferase
MPPEAIPCMVCGTLQTARPRYHKWGFDIGVCPGCGLGRTMVNEGFEPAQLYDLGYFTGRRRDGYADYPGSERALHREFRRSLGTLRRFVSGGRLLEVGCAWGYLLDLAQRHFQVEGLELCPEAVAACRGRGLDVRREPLGSAALVGRSPYDAVVMLDVIEHLPDPRQSLMVVREALVPGGHVLVTTGDFGSALSRLMGRRWRLLTPPQHLYFFTRRSIRWLFAQTGFTVVSLTSPWKMVPLGLALYQLTRCLGVGAPLRGAWLDSVPLPLNLFDAMQLMARRDY